MYIIIFLIYIKNTIRYYLGFNDTAKIKSEKIHPILEHDVECDEKIEYMDTTSYNHYHIISKQKKN